MPNLIEGLWDCPYCDAKGISGKIRVCPHCAKPRDKDTRFYVGVAKNYISQEEAAAVNKNPDWICSYCNSLNSDNDTHCKSCGASREDSERNYLENKRIEEEKARQEKEREERERREEMQQQTPAKTSSAAKFLMLAAVAAVFILLIVGLMPKKTAATILSKSWQRQVAVEEYTTVHENSWTPPEDAYNIQTSQQIHHYEQLLDHYETRERQVGEQVLDGYDTVVTGYEDLGNGYFEEVTQQVPIYHTEYRTEFYEEPVYVNVPVYGTMYYYDLDRWVYTRTEVTEGTDTEPYYADKAMLKSNERFSGTIEQYYVTVQSKKTERTYRVTSDLWERLEKGTSYTIVTDGDQIIGFE